MDDRRERNNLNLDLLEWIGSEHDGPTLPDLDGYQPATGARDSILGATTDTHTKLEIRTVSIEQESGVLTLSATVRYKPNDPSEFETDGNDYATVGPTPVMEFVGLSEQETALIEEFVPVAVQEELGDFRKNAGATISPLKRFKEHLALPDFNEVGDDFERYLDRKAQAHRLDEKISRIDELVDQIVYHLYGLTDEEIAIVEKAVAG
jgi:hypothetical protein